MNPLATQGKAELDLVEAFAAFFHLDAIGR